MTNENIVRAWKDAKYRMECGMIVPPSPVGEAKLEASEGAADNYATSPTCTQTNCSLHACTITCPV